MPQLQEVVPKYLQITNHYRDQILSGALAPGEEVPSERQIAEQWDVSRPTATRALAALRTQGLVESRQGSGTYVCQPVRFNRRARDRYRRTRESGHLYAAGEHAEILVAEIAPAPDWVAESLGIELGESAIRRQRVTMSDQGPVEVSTSWLRAELGEVAPRLLRTDRIRQGTVAYVERVSGRKATSARDEIGARLATANERQLLDLGVKAAAVLMVRHVVCDENNQPLECVEAIYPPNRLTFTQDYPVSR